MSEDGNWIATEIEHGRFQVENEKMRIAIFADFSGDVTDKFGGTIHFQDLRLFIDAAKILENALVSHYGGYQ
jgi:hypothetical protein